MSAHNHTIRGCTTAADLDDGALNGVRWLVVAGTDCDTLYITHDATGETISHIFTDPGERQGLHRILRAILRRPQRLMLAAD